MLRYVTGVAIFWLTLAATSNAELSEERLAQHKQMLYPVVRVTVGTGGGSGTVLYSEDRGDGCKTYVLTNHHVVESAIKIKSEWSSLFQADRKREFNDPVKVEVFCYAENSMQDKCDSYQADIVAHSKQEDLAVVKLRASREIQYVAKILPKDAEVFIFTPIWAVGCSLLHPPVQTPGSITYLDDIIDRKTYWMGNANIIYGNSGGAVFMKYRNDYYFIGVPSRVSVTGFGQAVTHMGYFAPITRVRKWLAEEKLDFFTDSEVTPTDCFQLRDDFRKVMAIEMKKAMDSE